MSNLVTVVGLKDALSQFLNNLISWLPIKGFTSNGKSKSSTLDVQNEAEIAMGTYNVSSSDTLMSIGNGTADARKNALEVKSDGSVYIMKDGQQVKVQDMVGEAIPVNEVEKLN